MALSIVFYDPKSQNSCYYSQLQSQKIYHLLDKYFRRLYVIKFNDFRHRLKLYPEDKLNTFIVAKRWRYNLSEMILKQFKLNRIFYYSGQL